MKVFKTIGMTIMAVVFTFGFGALLIHSFPHTPTTEEQAPVPSDIYIRPPGVSAHCQEQAAAQAGIPYSPDSLTISPPDAERQAHQQLADTLATKCMDES